MKVQHKVFFFYLRPFFIIHVIFMESFAQKQNEIEIFI